MLFYVLLCCFIMMQRCFIYYNKLFVLFYIMHTGPTYAIVVHLSDHTVFSAHVITAAHAFHSPTKFTTSRYITRVHSTVHALSCRTISFHIIVNKNLLHVFTKPPTQNIHTFSPRTSTKIPTIIPYHQLPLLLHVPLLICGQPFLSF